eukprot:4598533-Pleurochrysis_carterae.AAC.4
MHLAVKDSRTAPKLAFSGPKLGRSDDHRHAHLSFRQTAAAGESDTPFGWPCSTAHACIVRSVRWRRCRRQRAVKQRSLGLQKRSRERGGNEAEVGKGPPRPTQGR